MEMKIAYFFDYLPVFGGASSNILSQAVYMKSIGHKVLAILPRNEVGLYSGDFVLRMIQNDIDFKIAWVESYASPQDVNWNHVFQQVDNIEKLLQKNAIELAISIVLNPVVELAARRCKIPHIMNSYQIEEEWFRLEYWDVFAHYHICDSEYYAERWKKWLGTDSCRIRNMLPNKIHKGRERDENHLKIIALGGIIERKRQLEIIHMVKKCVDMGVMVHLSLCGGLHMPYGKKCLDYIADQNLSQFVTFVGSVNDVWPYLQQSDVLICASNYESFPFSISEAMSIGVTVISTPVGGVPEVIIDGKNGYLTNGYEADDLLKAFMRFLEDYKSGRIKEIIRNANETFIQNHDSKAVGPRYEAYYDHVVEDYAMQDHKNMTIEYDLREWVMKKQSLINEYLQEDYNRRYAMENLGHWNAIVQKCKEKTVYLWGASPHGELLKKIFEAIFPEEVQVKAFLDSFREESNKAVPILKPTLETLRKAECIWITVKKQETVSEICELLNQNGKIWNEDYFLLNKFQHGL